MTPKKSLFVLALFFAIFATGTFAQNMGAGLGPPIQITETLQGPYLTELKDNRIPVSIFLVNGIKLQGTIEGFDSTVILLSNTSSQLVYKHAISTIAPSR